MECPIEGCEYTTGPKSETVACCLLTAHMVSHQQPAPAPAPVPAAVPAIDPVRSSGPKLDRPSIRAGSSMEDWNLFKLKWVMYRNGSKLTGADVAYHLFQCAEENLGDALLKADPNIGNKDETALLAAMLKIAVIPRAIGILRAELLEMRQERDESFRKFSSKVKGKAETCNYTVDVECCKADCTQVTTADFTDEILRDVLLAGIYDADIRREMYGVEDILRKPVNDVISLVEKKEMARDALSVGSNNAQSSFKREKGNRKQEKNKDERDKEGTCPHCKKSFALFKEGRFGWNSKPFEMCSKCYRSQRQRKPNAGSSGSGQGNSSQEAPSNAALEVVVGQVSAINTKVQTSRGCGIRMDHHAFTNGEWRRTKFLDHPTWPVNLSVRRKDYTDFSRCCPQVPSKISVAAKLDSCAQTCLWSKKEFLSAGFKEEDLIPVSLGLSAANKSSIKIDGAILVRITAVVDGKQHSCATMVYISPSCQGFFMSMETMLDLDLFQTFTKPQAADCNMVGGELKDASEVSPPSDHPKVSSGEPCNCPIRSEPPRRPEKLPFDPIPENNMKMESWLRSEFASSTFNVCPRQKLPEMSGPPVEIHLKDGAVPFKAQTACSVPLNWQADIKEQLAMDEASDVIERPPPEEDSDWCFREVYSSKSNGKPRRTGDFRKLNKYVKRDAFATETPFHVARRIPGDSWKTLTDAWNGYHLVPLHENSRKYTNFISMEGKFRYKRCPQGASFAGDAFNRRHAAITSDVVRKETVVDDTCLYDDLNSLEEHWWRIIDYLILCANNGIVLNPQKFQFARTSVDFAGFRVSDSNIEPLPKYIEAIRDFPVPKSVTDIRSWFGLVNQVSNYAQLREMMRPFKPFLSPKTPFTWNDDLQMRFDASKAAIIDAIKFGVKIFDPKKPTCLRPDWSNLGVGYYLTQKHCECAGNLPNCCDDGWQITLAGSRFLTQAEQRYVAIEGEALAIAWALEQTKYFTIGCENLLVVTDHKPLVSIFTEKDLHSITNPRIFRLKQRTLPWLFDVAHLPGQSNSFADAVSRHPSPNGELSDGDIAEIALVGTNNKKASACKPILWHEIVTETKSDAQMSLLTDIVRRGFPSKISEVNPELSQFWNLRKQLSVSEDVVWYNGRVVLPISLRPRALDILHSAHQGTSGMQERAQTLVFWPGMTEDISTTRGKCMECCRNAPSQSHLPARMPEIPSTPFESVFADFFMERGFHYLVAGDRLSGWVEVYQSKPGSPSAGASGLVASLRKLFLNFGIPEILSSDGGPEFTASETQDFLKRWGVHHRKSSAYYPQSNGRAEVAVKKAKRLLKSSIGPSGSLNNDEFLRAMLQLRNTPDADCKLSPAQILFGHPLRDAFGFVNRCPKFENPEIQSIWRKAWACKEDALRARFAKSVEKSNENAHTLSNLEIGERVFLQNQSGKHPNKWDRSGVVIESLGHDQYNVKVDGTGRVTPRNRRFLRRYTLDQKPPALFNDGISMSGECAPPDQSRFPLYRHCQLPEMPTEVSGAPEESRKTRDVLQKRVQENNC